jgi:hypothetical protein
MSHCVARGAMGDMFYSVAPISRYDCNEEFQLFGRESIWVGHSGKHVSGLYLMRPFSL